MKTMKEIIEYLKEENTIAHMNNSGLLSEDEFDSLCNQILQNDTAQQERIKELEGEVKELKFNLHCAIRGQEEVYLVDSENLTERIDVI